MTPAKMPHSRATFPKQSLDCLQAIKAPSAHNQCFQRWHFWGWFAARFGGLWTSPTHGCDAACTCGLCLEQNVNAIAAAGKPRSRSGAFYFLKTSKNYHAGSAPADKIYSLSLFSSSLLWASTFSKFPRTSVNIACNLLREFARVKRFTPAYRAFHAASASVSRLR